MSIINQESALIYLL